MELLLEVLRGSHDLTSGRRGINVYCGPPIPTLNDKVFTSELHVTSADSSIDLISSGRVGFVSSFFSKIITKGPPPNSSFPRSAGAPSSADRLWGVVDGLGRVYHSVPRAAVWLGVHLLLGQTHPQRDAED